MTNIMDVFLDKITMYRLVLYTLIILLVIAGGFGILGLLPYSPLLLLLSSALLVGTCWVMNTFMSYVFEAPTNFESVYITALILALIITPAKNFDEVMFTIWAGVLAMATKYILALKKKHIFNPAAIAVVLTDIATIGSASWWIGTAWMMPFVLIGGYLIVRKLEFEDMLWSYISVAIITSLGFTIVQAGDVFATLKQILLSSSLLFLGGVMLTEPLTLPPTKRLRTIYGGLVGFLSVPFVHLGSFFFTPEMALIVGNVFAYLVSSKQKLMVTLHEKINASEDISDFIFYPKEKFAYVPGQYMEWTLPHQKMDSRGNRRYFTLASSPTEDNIRLGIKFYSKGSSYKEALKTLDQHTLMVGAQLAGDFTLPQDKNQKLVFMAGGIGVTPFRSMLKYLVDKKEKRDIKVFYTAKAPQEFAYTDVFTHARHILGIETMYRITDSKNIYPNWQNHTGRVTPEIIKQFVPDFLERVFYLSGPHTMVVAYEESLKSLGVKQSNIKKDFFPGLA